MILGDLVKLADWCHHSGEFGIIVDIGDCTKHRENRVVKVLVTGSTLSFHPDDFYVLRCHASQKGV